MSKTSLFTATILLAVVGLFYGAINVGLTQSRKADAVAAESRRDAAAKSERPVFAASHKHVRSVAYPAQQKRYDFVDDLSKDSSIIVVGIPLYEVGLKANLSDRMVQTYYQIQVLEVLKGKTQKGRKLSLRVPGGRARLQDGSSAETIMPDFWRNPEVGKAYVFFLKEERGSEGRAAPYSLAGGPQGLFAITPWAESDPDTYPAAYAPDFSTGKAIVPQVRATDRMMNNYRGKTVTAFLQAVRSVVVSDNTTASAAPSTKTGKESLR